MNRALRRRHRRVVGALWIAVPALLAWTLASRPPAPRQESLPSTGDTATPTVAGDPVTLEGVAAEAAVFSRGVDRFLRLRLLEDATAPDLLAYWTAGRPAGDALPADATLLGRLPAQGEAVWPLPGTGGGLVLYSLAHHRVAASGTIPEGG